MHILQMHPFFKSIVETCLLEEPSSAVLFEYLWTVNSEREVAFILRVLELMSSN